MKENNNFLGYSPERIKFQRQAAHFLSEIMENCDRGEFRYVSSSLQPLKEDGKEKSLILTFNFVADFHGEKT